MMAARVVKACIILTILSISIACTSGNAAKPSAAKQVAAVDHSIAGAELYRSYCASCHGVAGRGDGPAAKALKVPPPDLTALARRNRGHYPGGQIYQVIEWGVASHGSREMPVWGVAFRPISNENQKEVAQRIHALTDYLEAIQLK